MTHEEFFEKLNTSAKWDVGAAIARTNPLPLDANEIFASVTDLEAYIKSNALAYPGQITAVLGETEVAAYLITAVGGEGKGYSKLAATTGSGDVNEELTKLADRIASVEGLFVDGVAKEAIKAAQDGDGSVIADTYKTVAEFDEFKTTNDAAIKAVKDVADKAVVANEAIAGGTGSKITVDAKGLVIKVENASIADVTELQDALDLKATKAEVTALNGKVDTNTTNIEDLQNKIVGLTGAMHFVGVSTTDPAEGATVGEETKFAAGDVCLYNTKEFVYDGKKWFELGDEGSHLTKTEAAATYATKAALETVGGKVYGVIAKVGTAEDAAAADGSLFARIAKEVEDRKAADNALDGRIETLENAEVAVDGETILRAEDGTLSVGEIAEAKVTRLVDDLASKAAASDVNALRGLVGEKADTSAEETLFGRVAKAQEGVDANAAEITAIKNTVAIDVVKGIKINGSESVLPLVGGIVDIAVPTGALAAKDKVAEADLDETLLTKVNKAEFISAVDADQLTVADAKLSIKAVSTDLLIQGRSELVLDGGKAA